MKRLKYFKTFEAVIMPRDIKVGLRGTEWEDLQEYARENNCEIITYDEFWEKLPEKYKSDAPPRGTPFFGFYDSIHRMPTIVCSPLFFKHMPVHMANSMLGDVMRHEVIHAKQHEKSGYREYILPKPKDPESYFSDKNEIMAFSWSIANELSKYRGDFDSAIKGLNSNPTWNRIKFAIGRDSNIKNRYLKYIYLYLEEIFKKKE
jgi:hypothetical protein